ncbi:hypothetical protein Q0M94_23335 (plasmid) [Deinococcus radiomollis]|uniref:hypothetical protein n=1 Tax=Deinococcus radiomollis TaxID=468916 RepID=UPI0038928557
MTELAERHPITDSLVSLNSQTAADWEGLGYCAGPDGQGKHSPPPLFHGVSWESVSPNEQGLQSL